MAGRDVAVKTCLRSIMQFTFNATIVAILCGPAGFASAARGDTELVSVTADGTQATGDADANLDGLATSADGRYVAFLAPDLRAGSLGGSNNVFVRDRW